MLMGQPSFSAAVVKILTTNINSSDVEKLDSAYMKRAALISAQVWSQTLSRNRMTCSFFWPLALSTCEQAFVTFSTNFWRSRNTVTEEVETDAMDLACDTADSLEINMRMYVE